MPESPPVIGVYMGRFCPFQKGHGLVTQRMVEDHGIDRSLIVVGSQNAFRWPDVPFSFPERVNFIRKSLRSDIANAIEIIGMDDSNPQDPTKWDLPVWWEKLKTLQNERGATLEFYGGHADDLKYHEQGGFRTKVAVNRETAGMGITATRVRRLMEAVMLARAHGHIDTYDTMKQLTQIMHPQVIEEVLYVFARNAHTLLTQ